MASLIELKKPTLKRDLTLGGKYVLKTFAGKGGMGEVWKAWDPVGHRFVALKFIATDSDRVEAEMRRVQDSFYLASELNHQHICPSYGLELDKRFGLYLAMKWIGGYALDDVVKHNCERAKRQGKPARFPRLAVPRVLKPVADALDYSHKRRVLHRDVKPSNIFLEIKGHKITEVYLIDFGLAMLAKDSVQYDASGTCSYMPPEQWLARTQSGKTDQYSLAAVAYELYAGRPPFLGSIADVRNGHLHEPVAPIKGLPDELNKVLQKGLAKKMNERYETCAEFVRALEEAAAEIVPDPDETDEVYTPKRVKALDDDEEETVAETEGKRTLDDVRGPKLGKRVAGTVSQARETLSNDKSRALYAMIVVAIMVLAGFGVVAIILKFLEKF
ncbi:MAG: serine/threonine protein kinase [Thermoguttaceae bacterium]|nr:serine/threonine protein kinase [Thermoguttaceae bacterium]